MEWWIRDCHLADDGLTVGPAHKNVDIVVAIGTKGILYDAGKINAPKWLNDNIIIGMDDKDDGHRVVSSEIVYYSLPAEKRSYLTATGTRSEMYPFPVSGGKKIAFCTDGGEIYIMKIRVR